MLLVICLGIRIKVYYIREAKDLSQFCYGRKINFKKETHLSNQ